MKARLRLTLLFLILSFSAKSFAQEREISGQVLDEEALPVPGVSIYIKDSSVGTTTDFDGRFVLPNASEDDVLVVSYVGFETQEIPIGEQSEFNITLSSDVQSLNEVVVVGYGQQKRVNLTGAVATVEFDEVTENRPITDASQALAGKVAGVWVSQNSGSPGDDGATIRIRGIGTLNNTAPLILINGVEGKLSSVNPNDIESMTVLKDAASSAIYGSRAANGVVLITTKQGEGPTRLSYNGYYGVQELGQKYDLISNSAEYMEIWNTAVTNSGGDPLFPQEVINAFQNGQDEFLYPNTNYFDEVFHVAPITEHNVSLSGGDEKQNFHLSFNLMDQQGIIRETSSKRFGLNLSLNSQVKDWLEVGGTAIATRKQSESPYNGISRVLYLMQNGHPFSSPYTSDGRFGATQAVYLSGPSEGQPITDTRNPFPDLYNGRTTRTTNYLNASVHATIDLAPSLRFRTQYNAQIDHEIEDRHNQLNYAYTESGRRTTPLDYVQTLTNHRYNVDEFYWVNFNTLTYDTTIDDKHAITALAGMQIESNQIKLTGAEKSDPPKEGLTQVDSGTSNEIASGNLTDWRMLSYFGRLNYNFEEKYLLEANLRADGSSRFKSGNKWGIFPSFSAGWNVSKEEFMADSFIDHLKLRGSWGKLGNQNINNIAGDYPYLLFITQSNSTSYNLGGQLVPGAAVTGLVDEDISWETTESIDIGLEMGFLNNRLNFEFDYYDKTTTDILVRLPVPLILGGVAAPVQNVGEMRNKGVELRTNFVSKFNEDWGYSIGANVSYLDNEVVKFMPNSPDQLYLIREGYSFNSLYGLDAVGVYQSDQEAAEHLPNNSYRPVAGDLKYSDLNNDGRIDYQDKKVMGNTVPKYNYGLNIEGRYKNWTLGVVAQGVGGVSAYTQNSWTEPLGISGGSVTTRWRDAWTPSNPSATLPSIKVNDTWNRQESSFWVSDLSYFKIKNIQLSYSLSEGLLDDLMMESAMVYLNASNVHTFVAKGYEGFDPERDTFDAGGGLYPTPRIFSLGLNVTF